VTRAVPLAGACACLALLGCHGGDERPLTVITGSLPLYHTQDKTPRNDLSGATYVPALHGLFLVDDGGDPPQDPLPFYFLRPESNFELLEVQDEVMDRHGDLEATTFDGRHVYVSSSLGGADEFKDERFRNMSRFGLDGPAEAPRIARPETVQPRDAILTALQPLDPAWFERMRNLKQKDGGLNVEGLSYVPDEPGKLLVGLRSPHLGPDFPANTRSGLAIVVKIDVGTFAAEGLAPQAYTLDLGGLGVRSLEYAPTAHGYFVTAGIVEQGRDYAFYFWKGIGSTPVRITAIPEFDGLCRPESVSEVEIDHKHYVFVGSEESSSLCDGVKYNFLLVEMNAAFLALLR
jgi:hypothetical protein